MLLLVRNNLLAPRRARKLHFRHMTLYRVIAAHTPPEYPPILWRSGHAVSVGRRDDEWTEFLWCTDGSGQSAWVPESFLSRDGATAGLGHDYDSRELRVQVGEQLEALDAVGGWVWCRNRLGEFGWVPLRCLHYIGVNE